MCVFPHATFCLFVLLLSIFLFLYCLGCTVQLSSSIQFAEYSSSHDTTEPQDQVETKVECGCLSWGSCPHLLELMIQFIVCPWGLRVAFSHAAALAIQELTPGSMVTVS